MQLECGNAVKPIKTLVICLNVSECVSLALFLSHKISLNLQKNGSMTERSRANENETEREIANVRAMGMCILLVNGISCSMASIQAIQQNP